MCGQWSEEGYIRNNLESLKNEMSLEDWKRVIDELAGHGIKALLLRGGEVFMFPGIIELLEYIHSKGIFVSIDTNGTMLTQFAEAIARLGSMHLTISVDGTEPIHDAVRGIPGTFQRIKEGVTHLSEQEQRYGYKISRSICFTISRYNYRCLGSMPAVARDLGIGSIAIVPYYYFPEEVGKRYAKELQGLGCSAFSWIGFHHEESGIDFEEFLRQYHQYLATLGNVYNYPYMPLDEDQYRDWFSDSTIQVGHPHCLNIEKLIDIQPDGSANFCVDFIDYSFGNVRTYSLEAIWNGEKAESFRKYRREHALAVCYRCGAKYMSQEWSKYG